MSGSRRRTIAVAAVLTVAVVALAGASPVEARVRQAPTPAVTAVDLPNPHVTGEPSWWPVRINERGQVLGMTGRGWFSAPVGFPNPPVGTPVLWDGGTPRPIVPNGGKGYAVDLSDRGQAVGTFGASLVGGGAFSWMGGSYTQISNLGEAVAVNERGDVLHQTRTLYTGPPPTPSPPLVWRDGQTIQPAPIGWGFSYLRGKAVNDRGQVAFDVCWGCESGTVLTVPAIWQVGGGLGGAGFWNGSAVDINEAGDVASDLWLNRAISQTHAVLWRNGVATDLGTLGGPSSTAQQVNDRGHVMGRSQTASGEHRGFLWRDGRMTDLGTLGSAGHTSMSPMALNERDQVVGCSQLPGAAQHAFLWQDGRLIDLHSAIRGAATTNADSCAVDLNERGEIVGRYDQNGTVHAVKWTVRPG